ncbi:chemotaxis protein CheW [Aquincola sp. S2]|uniref:Chemotaxis protein CheW n=1 Tax=Pseudaquabacterium terrae TaxID=2732868 RepID=A0ABX2EC66_9BURK|nr:chemotaxis protein CheW [Aquabacterium terrae]NRF66744.1 chemotaxis protein CheW [Aquabacterium terrae]
MANKEALRELQARLAERMQAVRTEQPGVSWLAVDCAGQGMLFPLRQAGEIFDVSHVLPVPHTQRWMVGVANLRGGLYAVVDLAGFLGLRDAPPEGPAREQTRLVALNASLGMNCALMVDRLEGLRHAADMRREDGDASERPAFASARWADAGGKVWQEIGLAELAGQQQFLGIAG